MRNYELENFLMHYGTKGMRWRKHKYLAIKNGRYDYGADTSNKSTKNESDFVSNGMSALDAGKRKAKLDRARRMDRGQYALDNGLSMDANGQLHLNSNDSKEVLKKEAVYNYMKNRIDNIAGWSKDKKDSIFNSVSRKLQMLNMLPKNDNDTVDRNAIEQVIIDVIKAREIKNPGRKGTNMKTKATNKFKNGNGSLTTRSSNALKNMPEKKKNPIEKARDMQKQSSAFNKWQY